jgi:hypothetical protein
MINSSEQQDRKAERKRQEDRARAVSAARKQTRELELKKLHLLATEVAALMGGKARPAAPGNAWMFIDLSESHEVSFYREGEQISIRGRVAGVAYAFIVASKVSPADVVKAIVRKSTL